MGKKLCDFGNGSLNNLLVYDCEDLNNTTNRKGLMAWEDCIPWLIDNMEAVIESARKYANSKPKVLPYPYPYNHPRASKREGIYIKKGVKNKGKGEDHIAMGLFNLSRNALPLGLKRHPKATSDIGTIEDYQTPIFNTYRKYAGRTRKIDLISVKQGSKPELFILELKRYGSPETLVRCLMEAYSYSVMIDREKLLKDFHLDGNAKITICPLIFDEGEPFDEFIKLANGELDNLSILMDAILKHDKDPRLNIKFAILDRDYLAKAIPKDKDGNKFDDRWFANQDA